MPGGSDASAWHATNPDDLFQLDTVIGQGYECHQQVLNLFDITMHQYHRRHNNHNNHNNHNDDGLVCLLLLAGGANVEIMAESIKPFAKIPRR
jgi:hypothetical protein